jgi:Protein of unknown function (DUF664)
MISDQDFLYFVDQALDGMVAIVEELGDELANRRPDVERTNTPYVILTHCLGVVEFWGGQVVAGREVQRDREAEFRASGPVAELVDRTRQTRAQLARDLAHLEPFSPPRNPPRPDPSPPYLRTQGGVLLHLYEELAQHRGQMEGCRDVLGASWARLVAQGG